ncbi:UPF0728 protein C10orf53 homolog [Neopsephotus bourkii]|uniref:UPF0728 protein C10orf53 homolog n=1 Tax=Neopsephotus bourkii TaxID=309878 RepID=UPI002AA522E1|nr:UPF0728 protein C10orf53 homolog [Neopsephotus bourkii]
MDQESPGLNLEKLVDLDEHQLILKQIPEWNTAELVVNGKTVFHCSINDLDFGDCVFPPLGGDGKLYPLCGEARRAALNAY